MNSTLVLIAVVSVLANLVLLAKLARARRDRYIVTRNLVRISARHTQTLANARDARNNCFAGAHHSSATDAHDANQTCGLRTVGVGQWAKGQ